MNLKASQGSITFGLVSFTHILLSIFILGHKSFTMTCCFLILISLGPKKNLNIYAYSDHIFILMLHGGGLRVMDIWMWLKSILGG